MWSVARTATLNSVADGVPMLAAALAFYTSLSLAPLLLVLLWALSFVGPGAEAHLITQAELLVGNDGRVLVSSILDRAEDGIRFRGLAGALSLSMLLVGATAVFGQLQVTLNRVWEVEARPGVGVWGWLRKRLLSLGMVGSVAFLALVSLGASTAVQAAQSRLEALIPAQIFAIVGSMVVFTVLFAMVFKLLPDVIIAWRDVWTGAAVTAVLFALGKFAISVYLVRKGFADSYGAAGSIVAVLAWVYFSSVLVFFGAELTQEWAHQRGRRLVPDQHAVRILRRRAAGGERKSMPAS